MKNKASWHTLLLGLCLTVTALSQLHAEILHEERSLYSRILVNKIGNTLCLQFTVRRDQRNQSCIDTRRPKEMVFSYTRMSMASLLYVDNPQHILVIGLGGGTLPTAFHSLYPKAVIDAVEIDPAVVKVAQEYFGFKPSANVRIHTQDARVWTKRALQRKELYDIIVLDAFNGEYIPEHLMTQEYLQETKALLAPSGTLVANTFTVSQLYDHESATYASVFGEFINFRIPESANRVVLVPGRLMNKSQLTEKAASLTRQLRGYSVPIRRFARLIAKAQGSDPDWNVNARLLTDQFSPANLLQSK